MKENKYEFTLLRMQIISIEFKDFLVDFITKKKVFNPE